MKNLFLEDTSFGSDNPIISLPPDPSQWDVFLQSELVKKFPTLYGKAITVKLRNIYEGSAFGAIKVKLSDSDENDVLIFPIIIKDMKMYPIDIMCYRDKFYRASEDNIANILNKEALNLGSHKPRDTAFSEDINFVTPDQNLNILNPGAVFSGKTVVASDNKKYIELATGVKNYLDDISNTLPKIAVKLEKYPGAKSAFTKFIKSANNIIRDFSLNTLPPYIKAARLNYDPRFCRYTLEYAYVDTSDNKIKTEKLAFDSLSDASKKIKELSLPTKLAEDMRYGSESFVEIPDMKAEIFSDTSESQVTNKSNDVVIVFDTSGNPEKGVIIDKVIDFDLNVLPTKLFLSKDRPGVYAFSERITGTPIPGESIDWDKLITPVEQNLTVSFVIPGGINGPAAATFPFKVLSVKDYDGHIAYVGKFIMRNEPVTLIPSLITKTIVPVDLNDIDENLAPLVNTAKAYYVPENIKAVSLDSALSLDPIKIGEAKFIFKQAARDKTKIAECVSFGNTIKIKHPDFENDLFDKFGCAVLGIGHLYDKIYKKARDIKKFYVLLPGYESVKFKKVSFKDNSKKIKIDKAAMIKAAAGINDENLSMLNLSLGLTDSIDGFKFGEYIDIFKNAIDKLAKLLLASRLGMDMSDSSAIKISIDALDSIIQQLRTL